MHSSLSNNLRLSEYHPAASPLLQRSGHKINKIAQHKAQIQSRNPHIHLRILTQTMPRHLKTTQTLSASSLCDGSLALLPHPHHSSSSSKNSKTRMPPLLTRCLTLRADLARRISSPTQRVSGLGSGSASNGSPSVASEDSTQTIFPPFLLSEGSAQSYLSSSEPQPPSV